jgi:hypothetical protein
MMETVSWRFSHIDAGAHLLDSTGACCFSDKPCDPGQAAHARVSETEYTSSMSKISIREIK